MMAVHIAAMQIQCGLGDVYLAGGLDSMTHFRIPTIKDGMDMDEVIKEGGHMLAAMNPNPKLFERVNPIELNGGQGAERLAEQYGITREAMDRWALAQPPARDRGARAPARGDRSGGRPRSRRRSPITVDDDQGPRADTTLRKDRRAARPSTGPDGRITAGHLVRAGRRRRRLPPHVGGRGRARRGLAPLARIHTIATGACARPTSSTRRFPRPPGRSSAPA